MTENEQIRTPEEMASQQINATNPGRLATQNAARGGIADVGAAAEELEDQSGEFLQLMYEQSSELDTVDRIQKSKQPRD
ncbi:MAG TPA: hypothetical protein VGK74_21015 [Symbiobacteriaceae bacterium]|jgi:hypothetical protein